MAHYVLYKLCTVIVLINISFASSNIIINKIILTLVKKIIKINKLTLLEFFSIILNFCLRNNYSLSTLSKTLKSLVQ